MTSPSITMAEDLVLGARAIAVYLGTSERAVYHWADTSTLPMMFKIGGRLCLRKSALLAWLEAQEGKNHSPALGEFPGGSCS